MKALGILFLIFGSLLVAAGAVAFVFDRHTARIPRPNAPGTVAPRQRDPFPTADEEPAKSSAAEPSAQDNAAATTEAMTIQQDNLTSGKS